jgi:predicted nuclease with TOPRIM domain
MPAPEDDNFRWLVEYVGWAIGAAASGAGGWMFRRYTKDRHSLLELKRKMAEIDGIRVITRDGNLALVRLNEVEHELTAITESITKLEVNHAQMESNQQRMLVTLTRIETNQGAVLEKLKTLDDRLYQFLRHPRNGDQ